MRFEKFTTKLQEALAEAQSAALGNDNQYIEPQHLLQALLNDPGITGLLAKAGGNTATMKKGLADQIKRLPKVEGTPGEVMIGRDLTNLLNVADKEAQKDRKSTRLNSSHVEISYAVFCLKKKKKKK